VATEAADMEGEGDAEGPCGGKDGDESRRRCMPDPGISLHHSPLKCPDLLYCYEQCYEIKISRGGRREGYSQFKAVVGQLARFSVAVEVASAISFAEPGGLFNLVRSSRLIRSFIGGFQQRAQDSTVYAKATLLGGLFKMVKQHFGKIESRGLQQFLVTLMRKPTADSGVWRKPRVAVKLQSFGTKTGEKASLSQKIGIGCKKESRSI
jgi:hypothetical protein